MKKWVSITVALIVAVTLASFLSYNAGKNSVDEFTAANYLSTQEVEDSRVTSSNPTEYSTSTPESTPTMYPTSTPTPTPTSIPQTSANIMIDSEVEIDDIRIDCMTDTTAICNHDFTIEMELRPIVTEDMIESWCAEPCSADEFKIYRNTARVAVDECIVMKYPKYVSVYDYLGNKYPGPETKMCGNPPSDYYTQTLIVESIVRIVQ